MPYIKQEERKKYERVLSDLVHLLEEIPEENRDGHINYIVTVLLKRLYRPPTYRKYNRVIGVLECIKLEFYRRIVGHYEDEKIRENGDVE
jgi:hypothetical protein